MAAPQTNTTSITIPKPNFPSIIEGIIDLAIVVFAFNVLGGFFLKDGIPLTDQMTGLAMTLAGTAVVVKWVLSTKIWKRG
jgi:hypothetical protein